MSISPLFPVIFPLLPCYMGCFPARGPPIISKLYSLGWEYYTHSNDHVIGT